MDTGCKLALEFSENTKAMGNKISMTAQNTLAALWGSSAPVICL